MWLVTTTYKAGHCINTTVWKLGRIRAILTLADAVLSIVRNLPLIAVCPLVRLSPVVLGAQWQRPARNHLDVVRLSPFDVFQTHADVAWWRRRPRDLDRQWFRVQVDFRVRPDKDRRLRRLPFGRSRGVGRLLVGRTRHCRRLGRQDGPRCVLVWRCPVLCFTGERFHSKHRQRGVRGRQWLWWAGVEDTWLGDGWERSMWWYGRQ